MDGLFRTHGSNVALAWLSVAVVLVGVAWSLREWTLGWTVFGVALVAVLVAPSLASRSAGVTLPWPVVALAAIPFLVGTVAASGPVARGAAYAAVATLAVALAVQLDVFTPVEMNRGFGVAFVVMATMTAAGLWEIGRWTLDMLWGTALVESNEAAMWRLVWATAVGALGGVGFDRFLRRRVRDDFVPDGFGFDAADDEVESTGDAASSAFERLGLSVERQGTLVRLLQALLALYAIVGVVTLNVNVVVNASIGIAATLVPALIKRNHGEHPGVGLTLWIALAVGFHTTGTIAFYQTVWGWHNIAHLVTGTLVAGVGYTLVRAVEDHTGAVSFPPKFTFLFVLLFVFSAGVVWEIVEFTLDLIAAALGTDELVLAQHGLDDTMSDLVADTVGGVVVAALATKHRLH